MQDNIRFSIVIPTYNRAELIAGTIQSVLEQQFKNFEVIVVDDGSTDNTEDVIKSIRDSRLHYYKKENSERGATRNYGARIAKGEYINFVDSDDLLYPNHLACAGELIEKSLHPELVYLNYDIKDENNKIIKINKISGSINSKILFGNILSCNGVFLRHDVALKFPFQEDRRLAGSEDWELWLRLSSRFHFYYTNEITSTLVNHDSRSVLNSDEQKLLLRKELSLKYAFEDDFVKKKYTKALPKIESNLDIYISLHLALSGQKKRALFHLIKAFKKNPSAIFSRRFLAIIKRLI
jgi:glycosyltransferase involved in cell wall biosynthesis